MRFLVLLVDLERNRRVVSGHIIYAMSALAINGGDCWEETEVVSDGTSCITTLVVNLSSRVSIVDGIPVVVEVTATTCVY